ncbi:hypothetical protein [Sulfuricaulis sp.]|jgi:hypothetical protein|uniref:hypothetical protein n=1 Tax=Sulfuricaulis sp. TaxID=2003553 RepID=UPI003559DB52
MTTQDPKYKHKPSEKHTLEEVLKSLQDLIRNDLLDNNRAAVEKSGSAPIPSEEKPPREHTPPVREDFAPVNPAAGPVNLDAVMRSLKDLVSNELNVGGEPAAAEESPPARTEDHETSENPADEFVPLDEELTFEESMEIVPPPRTAPTMPEIPGEISAEMLSEPEAEAAPSPPAPVPEAEANIAPGTQHQLLLEETPPAATEPEPSTPDLAPNLELEPETDGIAPEMTQETAVQDFPDDSGDALPTIDVEETFDENAYFEAAAKQTEASSTDTQETQEIILSALDASLEPETALPANSEAQVPAENTAPTSESASGKPEIKLEIADEPATENLLNIPSVDFDVVEFELPREEPPPPPSLTIEAPAPADESSPITTDETLAQEITLDPGPLEILSPSEEIKPGATPKVEKIPDTATTPPATGETHATATVTEPATPETTESIDLDDIPVLREVVAPPAGSALAGGPVSPSTEPPLPAPDRARDIVVRAVAKLNVEMRKSGGTGLDTKTILRLQQLIRRELEKDGEKS